VGVSLYEQAARRGVRVQCEMGGKNPVVVLEDADLSLAVESTAQGAFGSTGQRCTATSRAIVVESVADEFVKRISERANAFRLGDGASPETEVGPLVDANQFKSVLSYMDVAREDGAELVCGGGPADGAGLRKGFYVKPTVFDRVTPDMRIAREEVSVFTNDAANVFRFVDEIETGMTHINSPTTGGEAHVPFGGIKSTGVGAFEQGSTALDFYTELKVVYVDYTGRKREGNLY
jgi:aldehyde dehydrogenase (NAD+)